ncbi:hypothetical protein P421_10140 [Heyndrickxia coagulans P38]|nr:hypothetical protein P421_10140 [Heyndrickxia coagulans P38]
MAGMAKRNLPLRIFMKKSMLQEGPRFAGCDLKNQIIFGFSRKVRVQTKPASLPLLYSIFH